MENSFISFSLFSWKKFFNLNFQAQNIVLKNKNLLNTLDCTTVSQYLLKIPSIDKFVSKTSKKFHATPVARLQQ